MQELHQAGLEILPIETLAAKLQQGDGHVPQARALGRRTARHLLLMANSQDYVAALGRESALRDFWERRNSGAVAGESPQLPRLLAVGIDSESHAIPPHTRITRTSLETTHVRATRALIENLP